MSRLKQEVSVHLQKARESALLAVETYNRPKTSFRSGGYIVMMCIAWTALLHAIFLSRKIKPFYRKRANRRHFEMFDGDRRTWDISQCASEFWRNQYPPERTNLEFFIKLRDKIEHRSMPALDIEIFGECQALLFNFEDLLVRQFGEKFALHESLSLALQFSCFRNEHQEAAIRKLHGRMARDIVSYVDRFRTSLSAETLQDLRFSYKVFLFPKPANREAGSDLAVEFIKYDPNNREHLSQINRAIALIKQTTVSVPQPLSEVATTGGVMPVRIVADPSAVAVRGLSHDHTHPYRETGLLKRLRAILPAEVAITNHDLRAVRRRFNIPDRPEFAVLPKFSNAYQYSEGYADWIAAQYAKNAAFFTESREWYRANAGAREGRLGAEEVT